MGIHHGPLFPTEEDLCSHLPRKPPRCNQSNYWSYNELVQTHIDLLSEDYIRSLREQVNAIRDGHLDEAYCYTQVTLKACDSKGLQVSFNPAGYEWEQEKRLLFGNLVFFTQDNMKTYVVGVIQESDLAMRAKGHIVVGLVRGVYDSTGKVEYDYEDRNKFQLFLKKEYMMVESRPFFFPYLHVTNALRRDLRLRRRPLFETEVVGGRSSNERVRYWSSNLGPRAIHSINEARRQLRFELNASQLSAFDSVMSNRVALVQGPPGTGKTFLGCKLVQFLLNVKRVCPALLPGPILVVTTTNHAVQEFLKRCLHFSDKVIHGYSEKHEKEEYGSFQEKYNQHMSFEDRKKLMHSAHVLAMTTTRAAYTRPTLDKLQIKVVIVEEAAKALEGYVLASVPTGAEHLIMFGDHKQLRPICGFDEMARRYRLEVSLFERLVRNDFRIPMLNEQRRMRPDIADLVRGIYPGLTDHPSTLQRGTIDGVDLPVPVFFISHQEPEKTDGTSFFNEWEAEMAAELCQYLLLQGHEPKDIAILSTYRKQISLLAKYLKKTRYTTKGIRISTVDGFQGDESRVVILSLVRNNPEGKMGFLKVANRACVALSRAKDGLILLGSLESLSASGTAEWQRAQELLARRSGAALPLRCRHGKAEAASCAADVLAARCCVCQLYAALDKARLALSVAKDKLQQAKDDLERMRDACVGMSADDVSEMGSLETRVQNFQNEVTVWSKREETTFQAWDEVNKLCERGLLDCNDAEKTLRLTESLKKRQGTVAAAPRQPGALGRDARGQRSVLPPSLLAPHRIETESTIAKRELGALWYSVVFVVVLYSLMTRGSRAQ